MDKRVAVVLAAVVAAGCDDEPGKPRAPLPAGAWAHSFTLGAPGWLELGADPEGGVVIAGGDGDGPLDLDGEAFAERSVIARFDGDGGLVWQRELGVEQVLGLAVSSAGIALVATCESFGPCELDDGHERLPGQWERTLFIGVLDGDGAPLWSLSIEAALPTAAPFGEAPAAIAISEEGAVVVSHVLAGTALAGDFELESDGDPFLAWIDAEGAVTAARVLPAGELLGITLAFEPEGELFMGAAVAGSIDLGDGPRGTEEGFTLAVARVAADDTLVWSHAFAADHLQGAPLVALEPAATALSLSGLHGGDSVLPGGTLSAPLGDVPEDELDLFFMVLDPASGELAWAQGLERGPIAAGAATVTGDHSVVVAATTGELDCLLLRYDPVAAPQGPATASYGDDSSQSCERLVPDASGGMILGGSTDAAFSLGGLDVEPRTFFMQLR